uniref:Uncharacterized protein n=1 Tax=Cacopsylla melanoneura TaxID=428564 RepID=A0A8D9BL03_9HEMI
MRNCIFACLHVLYTSCTVRVLYNKNQHLNALTRMHMLFIYHAHEFYMCGVRIRCEGVGPGTSQTQDRTFHKISLKLDENGKKEWLLYGSRTNRHEAKNV